MFGVGDAMRPAEPHRGALERLDLHPVAADEVVVERGRGAASACESSSRIWRSTRSSSSGTPVARPTDQTSVMIAPSIAFAAGASRMSPIGRRTVAVIAENATSSVYFSHFAMRTSSSASTPSPAARRDVQDRPDPVGGAPPPSSPMTIRRGPAASNDPGLPTRPEDVRGPADDVLRPDRGGDLVLVIDAVLEAQTPVVSWSSGPRRGGRGLGVVRLHAEQDEVDRADLGGIVRRPEAVRRTSVRARRP